MDSSGNSVPIPYRSEFYIYYTCKINPGILNNMNADQATSFTNTVTAWQDDTEFPSDSHTQEVKYDKTGTVSYTHLDVYKRQGLQKEIQRFPQVAQSRLPAE